MYIIYTFTFPLSLFSIFHVHRLGERVTVDHNTYSEHINRCTCANIFKA